MTDRMTDHEEPRPMNEASAGDPFRTCESLAKALATGETSSRELVDLYLGRIRELDGKLHAFVSVFEREARLAAEARDKARAAHPVGPLHGIPVAIKDLFDYAGHRTGAGSKAWPAAPVEESAFAVQRLEAAGMIVLGKTQTVEFAYGGWGTNPVMGTPWNPWDLAVHRAPGGSSSGSAVAVAAGLAPVALGSDTGGSVRIPACFCGLVGLKTSRGTIGRGGVFPLSPSLDTVGPLARSVRDAALLVDAMGGFDRRDEETGLGRRLNVLEGLELGIRGLRIGRLAAEEMTELAPDVRGLFEEALRAFEDLGARVEEVRLPRRVGDYFRDAGDVMSAESYANLAKIIDDEASPVGPVIRGRIGRGRDISADAYIRLLDRRRSDQIDFQSLFDRLDAIVAPICQAPAPPLADIDENAPPALYGRFVNFLDLAGLAVPMGKLSKGLPMGLQILVPRFDDALALRTGRAFEKARGDDPMRPIGL
jgi:aspartyl-tRNA(Asn)/glutamyl-tRNA(Gln) amidotransferase subunit A